MEDKGLNEMIDVFTLWINQVLTTILNTALLPFNLLRALLL